MEDYYDFDLVKKDGSSLIKSVLEATKEGTSKTGMLLRTLEVNPANAEQLLVELSSFPLAWLTVKENPNIKTGSARLSNS